MKENEKITEEEIEKLEELEYTEEDIRITNEIIKNDKPKKNWVLIILILVALLACTALWMDNQRTYKVEPMTNPWDEFDDEIMEGLDTLNFFKETSTVEHLDRPEIIGEYEILDVVVIPENLGFDRYERDSNYLMFEDMKKDLISENSIKIDKKYIHVDGKKHGYRTLTMGDLEIASSEGHSSLDRYIANDGYFRMYSNPQMLYIDMKMKGQEAKENLFPKYSEERMMPGGEIVDIAEIFIFAIKDENPVMLILIMGDDLRDAFLEHATNDIASYTNYDYAIEDAAKVIHKKLIDKYGQDWQTLVELKSDYENQSVTITIDNNPFAVFQVRYNNNVRDFEFTLN